MPQIGPHSYIILAAILFSIGLTGVLLRRNILIILMCIEIMLNAANLTFVAAARMWGEDSGQIYTFIIMAVAAAEAAVGLAIVVGIFKSKKILEVDSLDSLREDT